MGLASSARGNGFPVISLAQVWYSKAAACDEGVARSGPVPREGDFGTSWGATFPCTVCEQSCTARCRPSRRLIDGTVLVRTGMTIITISTTFPDYGPVNVFGADGRRSVTDASARFGISIRLTLAR